MVAIGMCLIEFAERASYYGVKYPFNNFINNPLPDGSTTGQWTHVIVSFWLNRSFQVPCPRETPV
jgi:dipeptide/tripeptide permease